jgi:glycosyltransferase involved in cell wall biosynthesis
LRIIQFVENLDRGGLERMALDLALTLQRRGHHVSFACLHDPGALAPEAVSAGLTVHAFHKAPGFSPRVLFNAWRYFLRERPDVVHSHNPGVHHYATLAARLTGASCVISTRHGPLSSTGQPYNERWFRAVMGWTDHIVHVSDHTRRILVNERGLSAAKSAVLYNGIALDRFTSRSAQPAGAWPTLRLGALGRLVPVKGHSVLLRAFARLVPSLPSCTLTIVGGGPLEAALREEAAQLGLGDRVVFAGPTQDAPGWLSQWDLFVFPSLSEGLPLAILEAMAVGLPIVSTRVGGIPEVAPEGEVAWYAEPDQVDELAVQLAQALASPDELRRRGQAARARAIRDYGLETMTDHYEALYRAVRQNWK